MHRDTIEIILNGVQCKSGAKTLHELILIEKLDFIKVATALNGEFVPEKARRETYLKTGDHVEILTARYGG